MAESPWEAEDCGIKLPLIFAGGAEQFRDTTHALPSLNPAPESGTTCHPPLGGRGQTVPQGQQVLSPASLLSLYPSLAFFWVSIF